MAPRKNIEVARLQLENTVRAIRDSLRDADHTFSARRRIIGSVSANGDRARRCLRRRLTVLACQG